MVICRNCGHTNSDKVILSDLNGRTLCNKCFKEINMEISLKKFVQRCPECNARLKYWKPICVGDLEAWYCKKCTNLFKRKGETYAL